MKSKLTDEQVEIEIEKIKSCPAVRLAQKEHRLKYKRRQALNLLKWYERRGQQLMDEGYTLENIESKMFGDDSLLDELNYDDAD